jgi:hypothetical protein
MELTTLVQDIHRLNHQLERFERKYGVMSETFYVIIHLVRPSSRQLSIPKKWDRQVGERTVN